MDCADGCSSTRLSTDGCNPSGPLVVHLRCDDIGQLEPILAANAGLAKRGRALTKFTIWVGNAGRVSGPHVGVYDAPNVIQAIQQALQGAALAWSCHPEHSFSRRNSRRRPNRIQPRGLMPVMEAVLSKRRATGLAVSGQAITIGVPVPAKPKPNLGVLDARRSNQRWS